MSNNVLINFKNNIFVSDNFFSDPTNTTTLFDQVVTRIDKFRLNAWPYVRDGNYVVRSSLKFVAVQVESFSLFLTSTINKIKILSAKSFIFSIVGTYESFKSLLANIHLKDEEGIVLSIFSGLVSCGALIDDFFTTLSSLELGFGFVEFKEINNSYIPFSLPLILAMIAHSVIRTTYNSILHAIEMSELPSAVDEKTLKDLKALLKQKLGVTQQEKDEINNKFKNNNVDRKELIAAEINLLKVKKDKILSRRTDEKIVNIMRNLKRELKYNNAEIVKINLALKDIEVISFRKIFSNSVKALMSLAKIVALAASAYFGASALAVPVVGFVRGFVNMAHEYYQTNIMFEGLELPQYLKYHNSL